MNSKYLFGDKVVVHVGDDYFAGWTACVNDHFGGDDLFCHVTCLFCLRHDYFFSVLFFFKISYPFLRNAKLRVMGPAMTRDWSLIYLWIRIQTFQDFLFTFSVWLIDWDLRTRDFEAIFQQFLKENVKSLLLLLNKTFENTEKSCKKLNDNKKLANESEKLATIKTGPKRFIGTKNSWIDTCKLETVKKSSKIKIPHNLSMFVLILEKIVNKLIFSVKSKQPPTVLSWRVAIWRKNFEITDF